MNESIKLFKLNKIVFSENRKKVTEIQISLSPITLGDLKQACANAATDQAIWPVQIQAGRMLEQLDDISEEVWHQLMFAESEVAIDYASK